MNEQLIAELAYATLLRTGAPTGSREWQKIFAELIVFECTNAVMDGTKEGDHYAQRIEQHFDNGQGGILQFGVTE
jgi:hypothetical protein